jgi:hypothetical protein
MKILFIRVLAFTAASASVLAIFGAVDAAAATKAPGISVGPIKGSHGYSVSIFDSSCGAAGGVTIELSKGSRINVTHTYSGGSTKCKVSRSLRSGSVSVNWPGLASIHLSVGSAGKLTKARPPKGCHGSVGKQRTGVATGTLRIEIHPGAFGRYKLHRAKASLDSYGNFACKPSGSADISVNGTFGPLFLSATQPPRGLRSVLISGNAAPPATGITDTFLLYAEGTSKLFNAASNLSSATIGAAGSVLTGSLTFSGLPVCTGSSGAANGSFGGAMVLHDPVLGAITLTGSAATEAFIDIGSAIPGSCNGSGAVQPTVGFTNLCSSPDAACSVSAGTNTDSFYDESDAGTETITSETWSFGDGSAPVAGAVDGSVSHTYAKPGTYTVTLTITTSQGQTLQATGSSYIES